MGDFYQQEQAYREHLAEQRRARMARSDEERKKRQEEYAQKRRERDVEKLDEQPFVSEMTLIDQCMLFCKNLTEKKDSKEEKETKETKYDNPDDTEILVKKEDRDEYYFTPTAKGKKGSKKQKGGGKSEGSSKPIKHNAETFRLFSSLKLDAPITTADIPALMEKLEALNEDYKAKVETWQENKDEKKRRILAGEPLSEDEGKKEDKKEEYAQKRRERDVE